MENLTGGAGNDKLTGDGNANAIDGGDGNDTIQGGGGNDTLAGGNGNDTVSFTGAGSGVNVNLGSGTANGDGTDALSGFENATGSPNGDTLTGDRWRQQAQGRQRERSGRTGVVGTTPSRARTERTT